ncbi:hypothetical protein FHX14_002560 [Rhizobium sp. BK619]|nr:hypothetical protein [Rhizobium sp. BK619]
MSPHELFERARALWPEIIPHTGDKREALNRVYWPLEEKLGCEDEWLSLIAWAFHQSFWVHAIKGAGADDPTLSPANVPFSLFDQYMRENLQDEYWLNRRTEYSGC